MYIKICVLPFGRDWHTRINTWNIIKSNAEYIFYTKTRYIFAPLNQQKKSKYTTTHFINNQVVEDFSINIPRSNFIKLMIK